MMTGLLALFLLLPSNSHATALSVMENTKVSKNAIFVSTQTKNNFIGLGISTQSYNGAVANVGLYSSSNVVVSNTTGDNVVIYATGSVVAGGTILGGGNPNAMLTTSTDTVSGAKTFVSSVSIEDMGKFNLVGSSVGISGAASTTISGLDGNSDGAWTIIINGKEAGTDGARSTMQPNGDGGANYIGTFQNSIQGASYRTANWPSTGAVIHDQIYTQTNTILTTIHLYAKVINSQQRMIWAHGSQYSTQPDAGEETSGGAWTNTTDNITSIKFNWNTSFTGSVRIYRDQY